jgi:hypothetical protein
LWGYVKDAVFVPLLRTDIPEMQFRVIEAVAAAVTRAIIVKVWKEMEYQMNVCHDVTHGAHIKCL